MNIHFNVNHNPDELCFDEALVAYNDIKSGFTNSISTILFKPLEFDNFLNDVKQEFGEIEIFDYSKSKNNIYNIYKTSNSKIYSRGDSQSVHVDIYTISEEVSLKLWKLYLKNVDDDEDVHLYKQSYFLNNGTLDKAVKTIKKEELNYISEKYYPYIDTNIMFDQFFTGSENILLLVGEPGLGKSKMSSLILKYAFENTDKIPYDKKENNAVLESQYIEVSYVKSTEVLANDKFWRTLEDSAPDFVIIDDLDYMLTKRDAEVMSSEEQIKNMFLNQFLSFTDGIEKNKTKFIITTNQKYDDIDSALLREGRLFDILELRQLDRFEALDIWKDNNLSEDDFNKVFTTHEILPAKLGSEINKRLNTRISVATEKYLKEDGISKVDKASRKKSIGL